MATTNTATITTATQVSGVTGLLVPPPRSTGDITQDYPLLLNWLQEFYNQNQASTQYLQSQAEVPADFDPSTLTDPSKATIASAQQTANNAFTLAETLQAQFNKYGLKTGTITISGATNTETFTFATADVQNDTSYIVVLTAAGTTGSPPIDAVHIISQSYTKNGFSIAVNASPGAGNSVTFNWILARLATTS